MAFCSKDAYFLKSLFVCVCVCEILVVVYCQIGGEKYWPISHS